MKKFFAFWLLVIWGKMTFAQELPQASPICKIEQRIGLTDVSLRYSRPSVKERTVWGNLVPYNTLWRTGANACTVISFSDNVVLANQHIPAGEYSILTIPTQDEWTFILNKNTKLWGTDGYKSDDDLVRIKVKPDTNAPFTETMTFFFDNIKVDAADLVFAWDRLRFALKISVDTDTKALANIKKAVSEAENIYRTYNSSATYLLDSNKEPLQALNWAKKSVDMKETYWNTFTLSRAYAANKLYKEAIAMAEKSLKLSEDAKMESYMQMNKKNIEEWKKQKMK
ncbi:MAG: hypothetical protein KatS3mg028_1255 [Bacteroidia bacterium]|jgi:hypothetical protein|nr:MAG: hypothetical protein KatS3mg028_1255 [Bacteroidia bacterium]